MGKKRLALGGTSLAKRTRFSDAGPAHDYQGDRHAERDQGSPGTRDEEACPSTTDAWESPMVLCDTRTFLCYVPRLSNSNSVTQSTTEAHGGVNPRRFNSMSLSDD